MKKKIIFLFVGLLLSIINLFADDFEDCFEIEKLRSKIGGASVYASIEIAKMICDRIDPANNTNSTNSRNGFVANISGSSSNLNLTFTGKNSFFDLNYFADGRRSYAASTFRKTSGWNLKGSLIINQYPIVEGSNISNNSSIQATHKSGLLLNFNRTNILKNIDGSSSVNTGEIGFSTKNKKYNSTFNGNLLFNNGLTTRIQMQQGF